MRGQIYEKHSIRWLAEYTDGIEKIAFSLCCHDVCLADDLRSVMYMRLLEMKAGCDKCYYFRAAKNAAIDFLRSRKHSFSHGNRYQHFSLDAMLDAGVIFDIEGKAYYPRHWIDSL